MTLTRRTRTGTFLDPLGNPCVGTVTFRINSSVPVVDLDEPAVVLPQSVVARLDAAGSFSASLICSDDANVDPEDWVWIVDEDVRTSLGAGMGRPQYAILVSIADFPTSDIDSTPHYMPAAVGASPYVVTVNGKTGPTVTLLVSDISDLGDSAVRDVGTGAGDVAAGDAPALAQAAAQTYTDLFSGRSEGLLSDPTLTYLGGTQVRVGASTCFTRTSADWSGPLYYYPIPESVITLVDGAVNHVYAEYSGGAVAWASSVNRSVLNTSNRHPAARVAMNISEGGITYSTTFGAPGISTAARSVLRMVRLETPIGGRRISGLTVSESATRRIRISAGSAYSVLKQISVPELIQGNPGIVSYLWCHVAGVWTRITRSQYSNSEYDDGTNIQSTLPNKYAVNWVFVMPSSGEIAFVLGNGNYSLAEAQTSEIPSLPSDISEFFLPLGRIIVITGGTVATQIDQIESESGGLFSVAIPWITPPVSQASAGTPGNIAFDDGHLYICYESGDWMRFTEDSVPWT